MRNIVIACIIAAAIVAHGYCYMAAPRWRLVTNKASGIERPFLIDSLTGRTLIVTELGPLDLVTWQLAGLEQQAAELGIKLPTAEK